MNLKAIRGACWLIGFAVLFTTLFFSPTICWAQQDKEDLPEFYPNSFSGEGCIGRITNEKIVIEDRLFKFTPEISFHTPNTEYADHSRFGEGIRVGFVKNSHNEIESIWFIGSCK